MCYALPTFESMIGRLLRGLCVLGEKKSLHMMCVFNFTRLMGKTSKPLGSDDDFEINYTKHF